MECKNKSMKTFQEFRKDTSVNEGWQGTVGGIARDMIGGAVGNQIYNSQIENEKKKNPKGYNKNGEQTHTPVKKTVAGDIASYVGGSAATNALWTGAKKAVGAYMAYRMTR